MRSFNINEPKASLPLLKELARKIERHSNERRLRLNIAENKAIETARKAIRRMKTKILEVE